MSLLILIALPGCGGSATVSADVTIHFSQPIGPSGRLTFHFSCRPSRGDIPDPAKACAALAAAPSLVTGLPASGGLDCGSDPDAYAQPEVTAFGSLNGKAFRSHESSGCWSPEAYAMVDRLGLDPTVPPPPHREATLHAGQRQTYSAAEMKAVPHAVVHCWNGGSVATLGVPLEKTFPTSVDYVHHEASLSMSVNRDGSVAASCSAASFRVTTLVAGEQKTFAPNAMKSVAQVIRCSSHGLRLQVGSGVAQIIPPLKVLYPRIRRGGLANLTVALDPDGSVVARCT